ncbi:MAG TPA: xanthine dehydrogenase subunit D, partial [Acidimicrobiales bacterium]|nr:xanthine dehydrogenase subunit D [Acidimicrobiales bacterium]
SSDLWAEGMVWGRTLRSPHPHARIRRLDVTPAWKIPGVEVVVTAADVHGATYGLITADQPVFASDTVLYAGQAVAAVAADHPETARRACEAIVVEYEVLEPLTDPERAIEAAPIHPDGNVFRHQPIEHGEEGVVGDVVVEGTYEIGMQDQAFLGLESALALPDSDGHGVELFISTQWLHEDRRQIAECLGLHEDRVRLSLAGVGGAFGAREDVSLQVHVCLLALRTGRPVKMVYGRDESFLGHVHRHPGTIWMRHHARADGTLVNLECRVVLDGGAYASTSSAVLINAITHVQGPYRLPNARIDGWAVRTNNPPCGAMRGFGVQQACFAHESQMDKLAAALGIDPVEVRLRNAIATGDLLVTGQRLESVAPTVRCLLETAAFPLPAALDGDAWLARPGGAGRTADPSHLKRGVGYALAIKNLMYSEGFDDSATARCRLSDGVVSLKLATAEVGQGFVTIAAQIARDVLGVDEVVLEPADTTIGSAGSTSASRQTWMSGGATDLACRAVREQLFEHVAERLGVDPLRLAIDGTDVIDTLGTARVAVADASSGVTFEDTVTYQHRKTDELDEHGQGACHVAFAFVAQRAVVDVDEELGLVRVVQVATAQDVGRALNPLSVVGQIEGGIAQGMGLAVMEEIVVQDGHIRNASFTDYLLPTALDAPEVLVSLVEEPDPQAPLGAKGVGEPPCIAATPAVVAAIRDATGASLPRVPVRPQDIALATRFAR